MAETGFDKFKLDSAIIVDKLALGGLTLDAEEKIIADKLNEVIDALVVVGVLNK